MKAYIVGVKNNFYKTVIFAKNRNQARYLAQSTDTCEYADYINIEAIRLPQADKLYRKGMFELEWADQKTRLFLVKNCGFHCEFVDDDECKNCLAKQYCDIYKENDYDVLRSTKSGD